MFYNMKTTIIRKCFLGIIIFLFCAIKVCNAGTTFFIDSGVSMLRNSVFNLKEVNKSFEFQTLNLLSDTNHLSIKGYQKRDSLFNAMTRKWMTADSSKMMLTIKLSDSNKFNSNNIKIDFDFKNISNQSIRLVDFFNDDNLDYNLSLLISSVNGKMIRLLGPAIVDFPRWNVFKYILIPEKNIYTKTVNVSDLLKKKNKKLSPGFYNVSVIYSGTYGKDCITGSFLSNEITITITD